MYTFQNLFKKKNNKKFNQQRKHQMTCRVKCDHRNNYESLSSQELEPIDESRRPTEKGTPFYNPK